MAKISKKRAAANAKVDVTKLYDLPEAMELVKESSLKVGLASSSPLVLIKAVLDKTNMQQYFSTLCSAENFF